MRPKVRRTACWVHPELVRGPNHGRRLFMIQSQGTFIFIAATVLVLVTVAAVVIIHELRRKRDLK
jgi:hypothetical protein